MIQQQGQTESQTDVDRHRQSGEVKGVPQRLEKIAVGGEQPPVVVDPLPDGGSDDLVPGEAVHQSGGDRTQGKNGQTEDSGKGEEVAGVRLLAVQSQLPQTAPGAVAAGE